MRQRILPIVTAILFSAVLLGSATSFAQAIAIGDRLELFVDRYLVDTLDGAKFYLHEPQAMPVPKSPLPVVYGTVIRDGGLYRAYYRGVVPGYTGSLHDGHPGEITCYAESRDGHEWSFPDLGICKVKSEQGGNVILADASPFSHNFAPFLDKRPGVQKDARFKALAGVHTSGLYAFASADGVRWKKIQDTPVLTSDAFAFDSQNVSFWSEVEGCYVCYFRSWKTSQGKLRTISKTTSKDYITWTKPVATDPNREGEHLYTSQTNPYFRAPHIYMATPTRFMPDRGESTDVLFMATRAGTAKFNRLFTEVFIRPGLDPARWGNRSNYVARNIVPTGPAEMSIYHSSGKRFVLRTDGFISVRAGVTPGALLTKPFTFDGDELLVNYSTSAAGSLHVELLQADGTPIEGFRLEDCPQIVGDTIEHVVAWKGSPNLRAWAGKPVRLRFTMIECDLYSFCFRGK